MQKRQSGIRFGEKTQFDGSTESKERYSFTICFEFKLQPSCLTYKALKALFLLMAAGQALFDLLENKNMKI